MDQTQLQQQIAKHFSNLPANAQKFFSDMAWMETLKTIATKYNLNQEQISSLGTETTLALLGIVHLEQFKEVLKGELNVTEEVFNKIFEEINNSILIKSIVPELTQAFEDNIKSLVKEKYGEVNKLDERFGKLPKEVQNAIIESGYQIKLIDIAEEKELSIDQMKNLEEVTNKVLLNVIHPDKYEAELKEKLSLSSEITSEIVNKVNEEILKNIREILRNNWEKSKGIVQEGEDEVPLPPYAVVKTEAPKTFTTVIPKPVEITPKTESGIYKSAGIEMMKDEPETEDVMRSIIGSKLNAPTVSKPVVSNQTIPKITPSAPTTPKPLNITQPQVASPAEKPHDPYHEAV